MGKAGRPPLEPRIAELEREVARLARVIANHFPVQIPNVDVPRGTYQPAFERWPGNER